MNLKRKLLKSDLISICDKFLNGDLEKADLEKFASDLIVEDIWNCDNDIISDIIFQWESQEMHFPINKINVQLWKHQLETGEDLLADYNLWNVHIDRQKKVCEKYKSKWKPINKKLLIHCSSDLNADPIHGFRGPTEKGTTGWTLWTGELPQSKGALKSICAEDLLQIRPELIKYFGLDYGYHFLIDQNGYEDIWHN